MCCALYIIDSPSHVMSFFQLAQSKLTVPDVSLAPSLWYHVKYGLGPYPSQGERVHFTRLGVTLKIHITIRGVALCNIKWIHLSSFINVRHSHVLCTIHYGFNIPLSFLNISHNTLYEIPISRFCDFLTM